MIINYFCMNMKLQKYHLLFIISLLVFTSCGVIKKKGCNTCPNFSVNSLRNN